MVLVAGSLATLGCGAGADVTGTWQGELVSEEDGSVTDITLELKREDGELTGSAVVEDASGSGGPLRVADGEVNGSNVTIQLEDVFGGSRLQGELNGRVDGDRITARAGSTAPTRPERSRTRSPSP